MQNQSNMKKYRLKKDLPTVRAGEMFVRKTNETMQTDMLYHVDSEDVFLPPSIEVDDINNFDEWFEEVKEFREFVPRRSEQYKCINEDGVVVSCYNDEDGVDRFNFSIGNAYPLDTPDETIIKEQKLIPQALHRLRMAAKKAWFEFDGSEGPDWSDLERDKFAIVYEHWKSALNTLDVTSVHDLGQVYFPTEKSARAYINNNKDDLKLLFGVE